MLCNEGHFFINCIRFICSDRQILDEVEIRQLLIDHVGHHCCWGSRPARTWRISAIEDCNVYVGTLETFIEERETARDMEPYLGGKIDGKDNGPELGIWELDLRSEFPILFMPYKETKTKIPHSEVIEKCSGMELTNWLDLFDSHLNLAFFILPSSAAF